MSRRHPSISKRLLVRCTGAVSGIMAVLVSAASAEEAPGNVLGAIQQEILSVFASCRGAVVRIEAIDAHGPLSGTGFFIGPNGTLYTSYTVGGESRDIFVCFDDKRFSAERLVGDPRSGVAILKIEAETPFLTFGNSRQLTVASPVIAVGYPMDLPLTPAFGTIGGFDLKYQGRYFATTHIRANIPVQRGEGGAPLLNVKGEVIGILISRFDSGSASFVLPIEAAEKVRNDFVRYRKVRPGWIGVQVGNSAEPVAGSTALVEGVLRDSPGSKAGLRAGDVLQQVGAHRIRSSEDVLDASYFMSAEDPLAIVVTRGGSEIQIGVTPVDPPNLVRQPLPVFGAAGETAVPALTIDR